MESTQNIETKEVSHFDGIKKQLARLTPKKGAGAAAFTIGAVIGVVICEVARKMLHA